MKVRHISSRIGLACLISFALAIPAMAQQGTATPIRIVSPYAPGGTADQFSRIIIERLSQELHRPVILDARPGANTNIGTKDALAAPADGATWVVTGPALLTNPLLQKGLWNPAKDFTVIGVVGYGPSAIVVSTELPFKTLAEFVAAAKEKPGGLTYVNPTSGTASHLNAEMFKHVAGIDVLGIPYKGQAPAMTDLISGRVAMQLLSIGLAQPMIDAGKLRALAVVSPERLKGMPGVPTLAEAGYAKGFSVPWFGYAVRSGTPQSIKDRLHVSFNKIIAMPDVKEALDKIGLIPAPPMTLAELHSLLVADMQSYKNVIEIAKIKIE